MKKALMGVMLLIAAFGVRAQEEGWSEGRTNAAASFDETSASRVMLYTLSDASSDALGSGPAASAAPAAKALPAMPEPPPKYVFFGDRDDYRWQLGVGVEFFRFQSNIIDASLVGFNTTLSYYTNSWFAVEGSIITGFAPEIYDREHVKLFAGSGGIRVGGRRSRWEPWAHALVGGDHLQPQTAGNSRTALGAQAGIGMDYRVHSRLSLRLEADWVYTTFFGHTQNNFQGVAGAVFHF